MKHQHKVILGGFIGNLVEAYDVSICYFLAHALASNLLMSSQAQITTVLALIFLAYLAKPIGALVLGLVSDLYGRKNVLIASILIMGVSTALIGILPSAARFGYMSAALLLTLRIIQSMALGSEFLNSASLLVESGDMKHRGFRGCWSSVGVKAGYLLACLITELTLHLAPINCAWAWRIPFLLAIFTTIFGVYIRYNMPESLAYVLYYADRQRPTVSAIFAQSGAFVKKFTFLFNYAFFASFLSVATGFFYYLYIPMHAAHYSNLPKSWITATTILSLLFVTILIPLFGWISDRKDRLKMLTFATTGLLILSYPYMQAINYGTYPSFLIMQLVIAIPCACYYSVSSVILTELFPLPIRCTTLSIIYSLAASLAAGVPPLLADVLARQHPNAPCAIMIILAAIVLINITVLKQRYRIGTNQYNAPLIDQISY